MEKQVIGLVEIFTNDQNLLSREITPAYTLYTTRWVTRPIWANLDVYTTGGRFWEYTIHFYDNDGREISMPASQGMLGSKETAIDCAVSLFDLAVQSYQA